MKLRGFFNNPFAFGKFTHAESRDFGSFVFGDLDEDDNSFAYSFNSRCDAVAIHPGLSFGAPFVAVPSRGAKGRSKDKKKAILKKRRVEKRAPSKKDVIIQKRAIVREPWIIRGIDALLDFSEKARAPRQDNAFSSAQKKLDATWTTMGQRTAFTMASAFITASAFGRKTVGILDAGWTTIGQTVACAVPVAAHKVSSVAKSAKAWARANGKTAAKEAVISFGVGALTRLAVSSIAATALGASGGIVIATASCAFAGMATGFVREMRTKDKSERALLKAAFAGGVRSAAIPVFSTASAFRGAAEEVFKAVRLKNASAEERRDAWKRVAWSVGFGALGALTMHIAGQALTGEERVLQQSAQAPSVAPLQEPLAVAPPPPPDCVDEALDSAAKVSFEPKAPDYLGEALALRAERPFPQTPYAPPQELIPVPEKELAVVETKAPVVEASAQETAAAPSQKQAEIPVAQELAPVPKLFNGLLSKESFNKLPESMQNDIESISQRSSPYKHLRVLKDTAHYLLKQGDENARFGAYYCLRKGFHLAQSELLVDSKIGKQISADLAYAFATGKLCSDVPQDLYKALNFATIAGEDNPYTQKLRAFLEAKRPDIVRRSAQIFTDDMKQARMLVLGIK